jgi:hypothetical protein
MNSNFNELTNLFFGIYSNIKLIQLQHNVGLNIKNLNENKFNDLYKNLDIFYKKLYKIKDNYILLQGFIDNNYVKIKEVKYFLLSIKTNKSRSIHDKIFTKILKLNLKLPLGITHVFEDFIKGITFFNNEIENIKKIPIYHRSASCGNSSEDFKKKYFQCYNTNTSEEIEIKKNHIFKCYLERLIYDDMFRILTMHFPTNLTNQELKQNKGHLFQISERAKNFNKCFLGINIIIDIDYDNNFPIILKISYIKDNNIIKKEIFMKTTYIDEYGNTRYEDDVFHKIIENNNEEIIIQKFIVN